VEKINIIFEDNLTGNEYKCIASECNISRTKEIFTDHFGEHEVCVPGRTLISGKITGLTNLPMDGVLNKSFTCNINNIVLHDLSIVEVRDETRLYPYGYSRNIEFVACSMETVDPKPDSKQKISIDALVDLFKTIGVFYHDSAIPG